jgi:hypothetical protein
MNHKYLGHLTYATWRSYDPLAMDVSCIHIIITVLLCPLHLKDLGSLKLFSGEFSQCFNLKNLISN